MTKTRRDVDERGPEELRALREAGGRAPGEHPPQTDPADVLARALERLRAGDAGAHVTPAAVASWKALRETDRAAFARTKAEAKAAGADLAELRAALKEPKARGALRIAEPDAPPPSYAEALGPDCPAPPALIVPHGYRVTPETTARLRSGPGGSYFQEVAPAPVVPVARFRDLAGGEALRVAWLRGGSWQAETRPRGEWLEPRRLIGLADRGFPVWGGSAGDLAEYLHGAEAANLSRLPVARVSEALGWQGSRGEHGFLAGRAWVKPTGEIVPPSDLETEAPETWDRERVHFQAAGPGDVQLADSLTQAGSLEGWAAAVAPVAGFPRVLFGLYAAFAAPLLLILRDVANFCIDWSWPTSTGKTTALRVAASAWGRPMDGAGDSFLRSWDATAVFLERLAGLFNGLPLLLDDSQRLKRAQDVAAVVYGFTQGQGRGRGRRGDGVRATQGFRSVLLSSGERPLASFADHGGVRARVLSIQGAPFGKTDAETGALVLRLRRDLAEHHGHAGPLFLSWLLKRRAKWPELRALYREVLSGYLERAGGHPVAGRLAEPVAAVETAARLAHEALPLPWSYAEPVAALWDELTRHVDEADRAAEAFKMAVSYAQARPSQFYGRHEEIGYDPRPLEPRGGWLGRWDRPPGWEFLAWFPEPLGKLIRETMNLDPAGTFQVWRESGWIDATTGKNTKPMRGPWGHARLVCLKRAAIEALYADGAGVDA